MLLCGGDQLLFGLYSLAIILLLIGGCLWGQGQDQGDNNKYTAGIVIFIIGGSFFILAVFVNIFKKLKRMRKRRKNARMLKEKSLILDKEQLKNEYFQNIQRNSHLLSSEIVFVQKKPKINNNNQIKSKSNNQHYINEITNSRDSNHPKTNSIPQQLNKYSTNKTYSPKKLPESSGFYTNPVFEPDRTISKPKTTSPYIPSNNAAKNYSRSLYNAHLNGKL